MGGGRCGAERLVSASAALRFSAAADGAGNGRSFDTEYAADDDRLTGLS